MSAGPLLSLAAATMLDADPITVVDAAAEAGFGAVGLRWRPSDGHDRSASRVRRQLDQAGITLLDLEVIRLHPDAPMESHRRLIDVAAELRPKWLLVVSHHGDDARTQSELGQLARLCAPIGCAISLEFMAFTSVRTVEQATTVVTAVRADGCDNIGVLVDALHLARSGGHPATLPTNMADHLSYIQLCDAGLKSPGDAALAFEARNCRLFPGEGELPLIDLLRAVPLSTTLSVEVQSQAWSIQHDVRMRAAQAMRTTMEVCRSR